MNTATDQSFDAAIGDPDRLVLVEFGTEWCAPCKQIAPVLTQIAAEAETQVKVVQVDIDTAPRTATALGVRGIPALFLFQNGQVIAHRTGSASKAALLDWIAAAAR